DAHDERDLALRLGVLPEAAADLLQRVALRHGYPASLCDSCDRTSLIFARTAALGSASSRLRRRSIAPGNRTCPIAHTAESRIISSGSSIIAWSVFFPSSFPRFHTALA